MNQFAGEQHFTERELLAALGRESPPGLVARRVGRRLEAGGRADKLKNPYAWCLVLQEHDGERFLYSVRGKRREWTNLAHLRGWLHRHGVYSWCIEDEPQDTGAADP